MISKLDQSKITLLSDIFFIYILYIYISIYIYICIDTRTNKNKQAKIVNRIKSDLLRRKRNPQQPGRMWGLGAVKGEKKWRWNGTGTPEGWLGEGKGRDPTPEGGNWGTTGRAEDQKGEFPGFPCPLGPPGAC